MRRRISSPLPAETLAVFVGRPPRGSLYCRL